MTYEEYIADLKPCPFCGSKDLYSSDYQDYPFYDYYVFHATVDIIQCNVCKATVALLMLKVFRAKNCLKSGTKEQRMVNEMTVIVCKIILIALSSFLIGFNVCFLVHNLIFNPKKKEKKENTKK